MDGTKRLLKLANGESIDREDLLERLEFWDASPAGGDPSRRTHLTVFITDSCSSLTNVASSPPQKPMKKPGTIWRALYFGHSGTVDISSSRGGKQAGSDDYGKSLFLQSFAETFDEGVPSISRSKAPLTRTTWT